MTNSAPVPATAPFEASSLRGLAAALIVVGLGAFAWLLVAGQPQRAWAGVLIGTMIPTWIFFGALFFLASHSLGGARWTIPVRRLIEGLTSGLPAVILGFLLLFAVGAPFVWEWAFPGADRAHLFATPAKDAWMSPLRWGVTTAAILAVWLVLRGGLVGQSLGQDAGGSMTAHKRWSVAALILGVLTFSLFTWDFLLSLDVHAVSAIWGLYCFAGAVQTFLAVLVLVVVWLRQGPLAGVVRDHTLHDLGTWTLAWGCIVAYAALCQYMMIYFADIPEERGWLALRTSGAYGNFYAFEAVLRTAIPFALLMSQSLRTRPVALALAAAAALAGNLLDLAWMVVPGIGSHPGNLPLFGPELLVSLAFAGLAALLFAGFWKRHGLVPKGDPGLDAAIRAEHLH